MTTLAEHERWMLRALELARLGKREGEVPIGAVLVIADAEVGAGFNQPIGRSDPTAHAEIVALRSAAKALGNYRLPGSTLYVTLEPCTMCLGALIHARVAKLVFGAREPKAGAVVSRLQLAEHRAFNHRIVVEEGVLRDECAALLKSFFEGSRERGTKS